MKSHPFDVIKALLLNVGEYTNEPRCYIHHIKSVLFLFLSKHVKQNISFSGKISMRGFG